MDVAGTLIVGSLGVCRARGGEGGLGEERARSLSVPLRGGDIGVGLVRCGTGDLTEDLTSEGTWEPCECRENSERTDGVPERGVRGGRPIVSLTCSRRALSAAEGAATGATPCIKSDVEGSVYPV